MKPSADSHVPQRMNCNGFGDPLTFHLVPSSGQNVPVLWFMHKIIEIPIGLSCVYMQI